MAQVSATGPKSAGNPIGEYFHGRYRAITCLIDGSRAEEFNVRLQSFSSDERGARLKRIYEVHLQTPEGQKEIRYVLAKSVGWGWLGYHAFLAGHRLSGFVPPILGLRDGILYMEWFPQLSRAQDANDERKERIETSASYVAARVRCLNLGTNAAPGEGPQRHRDGLRLLEKVLSKAYGRFVTDTLMRPLLQRRLCQQPCPFPTLIDGKMESAE